MDTPLPDPQAAPQWLLDALDEGEADIAAGRVSPWPEVRARMVALMQQLDAEHAQKQAQKDQA